MYLSAQRKEPPNRTLSKSGGRLVGSRGGQTARTLPEAAGVRGQRVLVDEFERGRLVDEPAEIGVLLGQVDALDTRGVADIAGDEVAAFDGAADFVDLRGSASVDLAAGMEFDVDPDNVARSELFTFGGAEPVEVPSLLAAYFPPRPCVVVDEDIAGHEFGLLFCKSCRHLLSPVPNQRCDRKLQRNT